MEFTFWKKITSLCSIVCTDALANLHCICPPMRGVSNLSVHNFTSELKWDLYSAFTLRKKRMHMLGAMMWPHVVNIILQMESVQCV